LVPAAQHSTPTPAIPSTWRSWKTLHQTTWANYNLFGSGFAFANFRATINGFMVCQSAHDDHEKRRTRALVRVSIGEGLNVHTPHWHGNVVVQNGKRTDVIFHSSAQMENR